MDMQEYLYYKLWYISLYCLHLLHMAPIMQVIPVVSNSAQTTTLLHQCCSNVVNMNSSIAAVHIVSYIIYKQSLWLTWP